MSHRRPDPVVEPQDVAPRQLWVRGPGDVPGSPAPVARRLEASPAPADYQPEVDLLPSAGPLLLVL